MNLPTFNRFTQKKWGGPLIGVLPTWVGVDVVLHLDNRFVFSSDQFDQIFRGAPHLEQDQAEFGFLARQGGQHGFLAHGRQDNITITALDADLVQPAAAQLGGDALAQG